eukprot:11222114-Lingulodinium_polyedra.AAC.1
MSHLRGSGNVRPWLFTILGLAPCLRGTLVVLTFSGAIRVTFSRASSDRVDLRTEEARVLPGAT